MTFKEIYNRILPLWGERIDFSDGMYVETKNTLRGLGKNTSAPTTHFFSESLSKQWNAVDDKIEPGDTFGERMVWTMYQVLQQHAQRLFEQKVTSMSPAAIDKKEIEAQFFKNLSEETWEDELARYERIIE